MNQKLFLRYSFFFAIVYFFSNNGLAALPNLSVSFLLKEKLGLNPSQLAYFQAVTIAAWVVKPVWGFISDSFPVFGYRRKSYLIIVSLIASIAWFSLGSVSIYTVAMLLALITLADFAYAFQDVVTDGLMVEVGKPHDLTGKFQSIQWSAVYLAMIITALVGGWVADLTRRDQGLISILFYAVGFFSLLTALFSWKLVQEPKHAERNAVEKILIRDLVKNKSLWLLSFFIFFWKFSPSVNAPFFYYAVDTLKFDGSFLGLLQGIASGAGLLGAIIFGKYFSKVSERKLLLFSVFASALMTLTDFIYFIPYLVSHSDILKTITIIFRVPFGIVETIIHLTILNLAARVSPRFSGGTIFALLMSFSNLGMMGSSVLGGLLFPVLGLVPLIAVSVVFTLFTVFIIPYLAINEERTAFEKMIVSVILRRSRRISG